MASKTIKAALKRCQEAISNNEWADATREVDLVLSFEPSNYVARLFKGKILTEKQSYKAAEGIYESLIKEEPSKIQAYLGLTHLYKASKEFQKLLDANCEILFGSGKFGKYDRRSALLADSLDLASSLENWPVYFRVYRELEEPKRIELLSETWERVPFQILTENGVMPPTSRSKKHAVFSLWLNGSVDEEAIPPEWMEQYEYENGKRTSLEPEHPLKRISTMLKSLTDPSSEVDYHKCAVTCRQELQAIEKFNFILARKNLAGRDIENNFIVFFKSKEMAKMLKIIILELTLFRSTDLYTAEEILKEDPEESAYDIYRTEFKYQKGALENDDKEQIDYKQFILQLTPTIPFQLKDFIKSTTLPCVKAKWLIKLNYLDVATELLKEDSTKSYLKTKLEGIIAYKHGEIKPANKLLLKSAKENTNDWETFYYIGLTYLDLKDEVRAVKCLKKSNQLQFNLASFELLSEYLPPDESLTLLESAPEFYQKQPFIMKRLAIAYLELRKYEQGMRVYQKLSTIAKDKNPTFLDGLGNCYAGMGSFSASIRAFKKALELTTDEDQENHILLRLSQMQQANLDLPGALETLDILVERKYRLGLIEQAQVWTSMVKDYFERWLPGLGGQYAQYALESISRALKSGYENSAFLWKKAADIFQLVASNTETIELKVPVLFTNKSLAEECDSIESKNCAQLAIQCYRKVLIILPDEPRAISDLSMAYHRAGDGQKALFFAKKAIVRSNKLHLSRRAQLWNRLGVISSETDPKLAQHAFCHAIESEHDFTEAWSNLGILYFNQENLRMSNQAFSRAQNADPENAQAWNGQAEIARAIADPDSVDLSRHSAELASRQAALAYAFYISKTIHNQSEQIIVNALTHIQKAANTYPLTPKEHKVHAVLAEKLKHYHSAAEAWKDAGEKIHSARNYAKAGYTAEALELIADFDNSEVEEVNFQIGNILMKCDEVALAGEFFKKVLAKNPSHQLAKLYCGLAHVKQGMINEAKTYLFEVFTRAPSFIKQQAIKYLSVVGWLEEDQELMDAVAKEASKLPEDRDVAVEINVRAAVVRGDLKKAKALCGKAILRNPLNQKPRVLLAKLLLKHEQINAAIPFVIHDDTNPKNISIASSTKLAMVGRAGFKAHKAIAAARHKCPWDLKIKNAFAASFDNVKAAEHLRAFGREVNHQNIARVEKVQELYFNEIAAGEDDAWNIWALCGLMRISGCVHSDISKEVVRRLENDEIAEELHMPVLATLAALAKPGEELVLQDTPINVTTIMSLMEDNEENVPNWLPDLMATKAKADNMPEEALKAHLLGFDASKSNKYKVFEVLVEAMALIKAGGDEKERENCIDISELLLKKLSDYERSQPMGRFFEGLLAMYSGDEPKGLSILGKLSRLRGSGAWKSATRYFLTGFYQKNPKMAKKLKDLFKNEDPNDPFYDYSKKVHGIE